MLLQDIAKIKSMKKSTDFIIPLISTGTGVGVSTLKLVVRQTCVMTIDKNGFFYSDAAGTLNESKQTIILSGAIRTFYLKVTSGTCNIKITNGMTTCTQFNEWISTTNAASIYKMYLSSIPSVMTSFTCTGSNTITGNLSSIPSVMTYFICTGSNTITGNLSSIPSVMTYFTCIGSNTITGNLSSIPSVMTSFYCTGSNTITGNLSSIPSVMTSFYCTGNNTIQEYTGKVWANNMQRIYLRSNTNENLTPQMNDQLLIDLNNAGGTWNSDKIINLKGTRTSTSDAAVAALITKTVSVTVTP